MDLGIILMSGFLFVSVCIALYAFFTRDKNEAGGTNPLKRHFWG